MPWYESEWFKEWERLARKEYQGQTDVPNFGYQRGQGPFAAWKADGASLQTGMCGRNTDNRH